MKENFAIYAALRERFCAPEYALFFEVANGTGSNIRRYADALAMSLFPSRGLTIAGFEIKVSRNDWRRELRNPHKAEEGIFKFCDFWWIVAPAGVVEKSDLPPTWGLLELGEKKLRQAVDAPRLKPTPMTRNFIAAVLRRASEADEGIVDEAVRRKDADREARFEERVEERVKYRVREFEQRLGAIQGIERQLGISLTDYNAHEGYGRIIKAIDATGVATQWRGLRELARSLSSMAENLQAHIAQFDAIAPMIGQEHKEEAA